ncbi:hypothetical protein ABZY36_30075 [Streptomyces sp. NPDC006627]|uniref:hypothetical protein n=1 Tax=Streptomyces sp. NPDC006627 TaxID=3154679 RepID=UPI0033A1D36B
MDAALLLAKMLVPEPLRPGWSDAPAMSATLIPRRRLLDSLAAVVEEVAECLRGRVTRNLTPGRPDLLQPV